MNSRKSLIALSIVLFCVVFVSNISEAAVDENQMIDDILEERSEEDSSTEPESPQQQESDSQQQEAPASDSSNDEDTSTGSDPEMMEGTSIVSMLIQLILALAAVIAIMYFLLKFINKRTQSFQSQKTMQNLGGVPLGQNKSVQLVKVGDRLLVVGVGDSIRLLKEIDEETEMDKLLENDDPDSGWKQKGFSIFQGLFKNNKTKENSSESFQEVLKDQLGEMKDTRKKARRHLKGYNE
ncbi:flagellar biosynthetic protein FliO [Salibacterium salarium]|uniref:Flagellar protein n=1 Tax=Salibacterium salarium TaxID=284579 RepID=A0A3R9P986_9BACI|nr:flagellar biosynthetic protein FliO [Salibacterium salarium]RSL33179.1 flagellar biosynthetic protein FliO [Salibacterium salarium]